MNFLHPQTVHFPIALLIVAAGIYVFSLFSLQDFYRRVAYLLHALGLIGLVLATFSGRQAEAMLIEKTPEVEQLLFRHEWLAYTSIWLFAMMLVWQYLRAFKMKHVERLIFTLAFILFSGLLIYSSHIGGSMVYEHGVGMIKPS